MENIFDNKYLNQKELVKDHFYYLVSNFSELNQKQKVIASTGNISFIIMRLMLLFGYFNYGNRGILDKTHTRLFTFSSFKKLFLNNYEIIETKGIPAPFPLALGHNIFSKILLNVNIFLIKLSKTIFSYQILLILRPKPSLKNILEKTIEYSKTIK